MPHRCLPNVKSFAFFRAKRPRGALEANNGEAGRVPVDAHATLTLHLPKPGLWSPADVGVWLHRYVGIRASVVWAQTDVSGPASADVTGVDPNVWAYSGDVVLRVPIDARSGWIVPYIVGGLGAKTYDFDGVDTETELAVSFGGGVEYRFPSSRWGVNLEARDYVSSFELYGIDETQHDLVWTGGITLSF